MPIDRTQRSTLPEFPVNGSTPDDPGFTELFGANFMLHTTPGSAISAIRNPVERAGSFGASRATTEAFLRGDGYDPIPDLEPQYRPYAERFLGVTSEAAADNLKAKLDAEIEYRDIAERAGLMPNLVTGVATQFFDPVNYVPFAGPAAKGASLGTKVVKGAQAGLLGTVAQEPILHGLQETRTLNESAVNAFYGALFGGALSGAVHAAGKGLQGRKDRKQYGAEIKTYHQLRDYLYQKYSDVTPTENVTADAIKYNARLQSQQLAGLGARAVQAGLDPSTVKKALDVSIVHGTSQQFSRALFQSSLRKRYALELRKASGGKNPNKIKLTRDRIEKAKKQLNRRLKRGRLPEEEFVPDDMFPDYESFISLMKYFDESSSKQLTEAKEFASAAIALGEKLSFRMPDGKRGSIYVKIHKRGTVRFSDHEQPIGYDGSSSKRVYVGGYSKTLGRRHGVATFSVDPHSGISLDDAINWITTKEIPKQKQILYQSEIDSDPAFPSLRTSAEDHGYSAGRNPNVSELVEIVNQNNGAEMPHLQFDGTAPRGAISFDGTPLIGLFEGANASTLPHEAAHHFLDTLLRFHRELGDKSPFKDDVDEVLRWVNSQNEGLNATIDDIVNGSGGMRYGMEGHPKQTVVQETFARGFEQYLREGQAPSEGLRRIFEQFKEWLTSIYRGANELGVELDDDIRAFFDNAIEPDISRWPDGNGSRPVASPKSSDLSAASTDAYRIYGQEFEGGSRPIEAGDFKSVSRLGRVVQDYSLRLLPADFVNAQPSAVFSRIWHSLAGGQADSLAKRRGVVGTALEYKVDAGVNRYSNIAIEILNGLPKEYRRGRNQGEVGKRIMNAIANPQDETDEVIRTAADRLRQKVFEPIGVMLKDAGLIPDEALWTGDQFYSPHNYDADKILANQGDFLNRLRPIVRGWLEGAHANDMDAYDVKIDASEQELASLRSVREAPFFDADDEALDLDAINNIMSSENPAVAKPQRLREWVVNQGGLWEGDASGIAGLEWRRPGLIKKSKRIEGSDRGGWPLDDMRERAVEQGWLNEDATLNEFIDMLSNDIAGDPVYRAQDADLVAAHQAYDGLRKLKGDIRSDEVASQWRKVLSRLDKHISGIEKRVDHLMNERTRKANIFDDELELQSDIDDIARKIERKITGRLDDAEKAASGGGNTVIVDTQGFVVRNRKLRNTKRRALDLPRETLSDYMNNDPLSVVQGMIRGTIADIYITRELGDNAGAAQRIAIQRDFERLIQQSEGEEGVGLTLVKQREKALTEFDNAILSIKGRRTAHYRNGMTDASRSLRNISYAAYLGNVTVSSTPDVVRPLMAQGIQGLVSGKAWNVLMRNVKQSLAGVGDEYQYARYGAIAERSLASRVARGFDLDENRPNQKGIATLTDKAAYYATQLSLISRWNQFWKGVALDMVQDRLYGLRNTAWDDLREADKSWLSVIGLGDFRWNAAREQIAKHGENRRDGAILRVENWDDSDLAENVMGSMTQEVDSIIITPGIADRASTVAGVDLQHPFAKLLLQFKSFFLSAQQRLTLRLAQDPDRLAAASTTMMMVVMGMAVDQIKAWSGKYEASDNIGHRIVGGIDRSGVLGTYMEVNNMLERGLNLPLAYRGASATAVGFGLADENDATVSSRYRQRSVLGSLAGPSAGYTGDVVQIVGDVSGQITGVGEGVTGSTVTKVRNVTPFHNVPVIREITNWFIVPNAKAHVQ